MDIQEGICTFCLGKCESFKAIDGNMKNTLETLLPKIDFTVIQAPVMCKNCEEMLIKWFDFKTMCLHTWNYIVPFLNNKDDVKLDLKDVYLSRNITDTGVPEDQNVCGFCMGLVKNCSAVSLEVKMLKKMIAQCLPELDLSIIKTPVICASCHGSLGDCFHFVMNRLIVREEINKYCETSNININDKIELSSSLQLAIGDVDGNSTDIIKIKEEFCEDTKYPDERDIGDGAATVKIEQIFLIDSTDAIKDVENKNESFMEIGDYEVNKEQFTPKNMLASAEKSNTIKIEEVFCEPDVNRFEDGIVLPQSEGLPTHKDRLEVKMYKCDTCLHQTKHKNDLKKHLILHKNPSELTMYKCDHCSFQTKHKRCLKDHLLTHKDPSELTMYKCDHCSFQTKHKGNLKDHLLTHKDPSEVPMYKCYYCSFQTKRRSNLKDHELTHKDPSEVTMYKCDSCLYQTKHKNHLKKHLILHKNPSEVKMYKCDFCSFETKVKCYLKNHLLVHKDPSEVTMYKCDTCSFETKWKYKLGRHLLVHKDPSEVTMFKCDFCLYQTKHKNNLKKHQILHKNS